MSKVQATRKRNAKRKPKPKGGVKVTHPPIAAIEAVGAKAMVERQDRALRLLAHSNSFFFLLRHMMNGGTATDWAKLNNIDYSDLIMWINQDQERMAKFKEAKDARRESLIDQWQSELQRIGFSNWGMIVLSVARADVICLGAG
jgi:hypothetical protein